MPDDVPDLSGWECTAIVGGACLLSFALCVLVVIAVGMF